MKNKKLTMISVVFQRRRATAFVYGVVTQEHYDQLLRKLGCVYTGQTYTIGG
jgi:hypothetical protein